jgi:uncharacterized membrane protein
MSFLRFLMLLSLVAWIGGLIFFAFVLAPTAFTVLPSTLRHVLLCLMLALTLVSQFGIIPRMDVLRASLGDVRSAPIDNPERIQFDALHVRSTRIEGAVLLLGLVVVYMTAKSF